MSDSKPADRAAVIRRVDAAEETAQERLMKKHVPAWVISGAVHVGVIAIMILLFGARGAATKPPEKIVATSVDKGEEQPTQDLTVEDPGLQSNLEAALPDLDRVEQQTVEAAVTMDTLGQPNAPDTDNVALALPGLITGDPTTPGLPGETGTVASGTGGLLGISNSSFAGRGGSTKSQLLAAGGGNEESERAVAMGLAWLALQQKPDGRWEFDGASKDEVIAATGMALLPFLAAGETHKAGKRYQKTVYSGLDFLRRNCPASGKFTGAGNMYAQAIGALALCEAYGMTKDSALRTAAQASVNYIQKAQAPNGSWGYSAGNPGDTSIVGWQIQALEAAQLSKDLVVEKGVVEKANKFLDLAGIDPVTRDPKSSKKSAYGYNDSTGAQPGTSLTAVGLLSRYYFSGWTADNVGMAEGVKGLMRRAPGANPKPKLDMYYYYYATQVVHFFEGDEWRDWNEGPKQADGTRKGGMRDWLVGLQHRKDGANKGSWDPDGDWIGRSCGRLGTTALCVLTLEVYYRHLPLYKRKTNAGNADAR